jgi:putative chitinase
MFSKQNDIAPSIVKSLISAVQLQQIMPLCPANDLQIFSQSLSGAMVDGNIDTLHRIACFVGQLALESDQLRAWVENLNYSASGLMSTWPSLFPNIAIANQYAHQPVQIANRAYGNRMGNGTEQSGDGFKYRGRSPMQLTGKANYMRAGQALGIDLVNNPDLAATPDVGFKIAVWFWNSHNLSVYADQMDVQNITRIINGGLIGLTEREAFTQKALSVLSQP